MARIWMQVSKDEIELPLVVADTAEELARKTGKKANTIASAIIKARQKGYRCQYKVVEVDDGTD